MPEPSHHLRVQAPFVQRHGLTEPPIPHQSNERICAFSWDHQVELTSEYAVKVLNWRRTIDDEEAGNKGCPFR